MTTGSRKVFDYLKDNADIRMTAKEIQEALGLEKLATVTGCVNGLVKKGYAVRQEESATNAEGEAVTIKYIVLTDAGKAFNPDAEAAE